jgi:Alternative oxidase
MRRKPATAFSLARGAFAVSHHRRYRPPSFMSMVYKDPGVEGDVSTSATPTSLTDTLLRNPIISDNENVTLERQTMDESVFHFNKILIDSIYNILCFLYPIQGTQRDFCRFFVLETVARVPYFAYLSVLHLRETFGEREHPDRMKTHYAQADNEYHHLLIMEALGGNEEWLDRVVAQTMAFVYYWYVVAIYLWYPPAAYHLSELIEDHAYNTYNNFLNEYEDKLKTMDVPDIAKK